MKERVNWEMVGVIVAIVLALGGAIGSYAVAKNKVDINQKSIEKITKTYSTLADKTQTNREDIKVINAKLDNISQQQAELKETLKEQNGKLELILRKLD